MNKQERLATISLAAIFSLRMLGLFMLLPVLTVASTHYPDYSLALAGLALGAYGATQAVFQIPLGMLSDRIGRKPVIVLGLLVFITGSLLAAYADTLAGLVVGRVVQGAGAISAAIMALAADLTRPEQRTKSMAIIGMSIGMSFIVAMIVGPLLTGQFGLASVFIFAALGGGLAILLLCFVTPSAAIIPREKSGTSIKSLFYEPQLRCLNISVFILHALLMACFALVPIKLKALGYELQSHAWIYLSVFAASLLLMIPLLAVAERQYQHRNMLRLAILLIFLALGLQFLADTSFWLLVVALWLFFGGFNAIEAMLPSLLSRLAPSSAKGAALGIFNTHQFMGAFVGGATAGKILQTWGEQGIYLFSLVLCILWLASTVWLKRSVLAGERRQT